MFSFVAVLFLFRAFVFIKVWDWFLIPIFSVPHINIAAVIGLSLCVSLFTWKHIVIDKEIVECKTKKDAFVYTIKTMWKVFQHPMWILLFAWLIKDMVKVIH